MKKALFLLIIIAGIAKLSFCQQGQIKIDSLFTVLKTAKEDTAKVNILNALAYEIASNNPDTAVYFANEALALATKLNYKMGIADAYLNIGIGLGFSGKYEEAMKNCNDALTLCGELLTSATSAYRSKILERKGNAYNYIGIINLFQNNYPEALENFSAALRIYQEIGNKKGSAKIYNNFGNIYYVQENFPEALMNYFASLKIAEETGDKTGLAHLYNNIGLIYYDQGNYAEALSNYSASLKIDEELGDQYGKATDIMNIGVIYKDQSNYAEALKNLSASLSIFEEIGDKDGMTAVYRNIGLIYSFQNNCTETLKNYFAALSIAEETGDKVAITDCFMNIGNQYIILEKYSDASLYLHKGLSLAKEIGNYRAIKYSYMFLSELDSLQGNLKQSMENFKMYITYRDSIVKKENAKKTIQIQMQYEFDKKESLAKAEQEKKNALALKELQKQKLLRNGFVGGFAVVLIFAGVFFTQRKRIKKGKKLSDELLLNILPSEVAEELKQKGSAEAKQFDFVTVMFTDFINFTQISEKLSPAELVAEIDTCYKEFDHIITKYDIEKIKTNGDSYMCAGGLPVPNKTNPTDVVTAALEFQRFINQRVQKNRNEGKEVFEMRIGIHTGPVVAGIVGVKKFAYDIWGDTVNIASRMESSGEAGKVNISEATHELVKDKFNCTYRGKIEAKHIGMIDMYFVTNPLKIDDLC